MERKIVVFVDIDGTQNLFTIPIFGAVAGLLRGKFALPEPGQPAEPVNQSGRFNWLNVYWHQMRPFTTDSHIGLEILRGARRSTRREIGLAIVSGRGPGLHRMTYQQLEAGGRADCFDVIHLRESGSSPGYKETVVQGELEKGHSVVLLEDDFVPALRVSRLQVMCQEGQKVWVGLLGNIFNHAWLLKRGHVVLPDNVYRASSFQDAATTLVARIHGGLI